VLNGAPDFIALRKKPEDGGTAATHHRGLRTQFQQTPLERF
jgi:hypothetical protein